MSIAILFLALTLVLLTPLATTQDSINQGPIGGYRFFVIAGIAPTLHIIFELLDQTKPANQLRNMMLSGLQLLLLLSAASVRLSAMYFVGAIVLTATLLFWMRRADPSRRRTIATKSAFLAAAALVIYLSGVFLAPKPYRSLGLVSDAPWHRAFVGLGAHPDWPFGNLADAFDCKPEIPEGLVPGRVDRNAHCVYADAVKRGAKPGVTYGAQYEKLVRQAFFRVAREYPWKVFETYLFYKPMLIWETLSISAKLSISYRDAPVLIALVIQFAILMFLIIPLTADRRLPEICGAFALLCAFSLGPPFIAWSTIPTSPDLICYMYVGFLLILVGAAGYLASYFNVALLAGARYREERQRE